MDKRYLKEHIETFECYLENHFLNGHRSFDYIKEYIEEQNKEIERLNNIINELENYFNKIKDTSTLEERMIAKYMLKYIKELKGSDKEW